MAAMDVTQPEAAVRAFEGLIAELGGVDLVVVNAGVGITNPELDWPCELQTIAVNVSGFVVLASAAYRYFAARGGGHLAGITSIAGLRGSRFNPAYGASKAFDISYLEALRARARFEGHAIAVTDIRPGFVDTPMTEGQRGMFWVATAEKAARRIADALRRKARVAYITRRWALPAWVLKWAPGWLLDRV
jgi:short-subunit dehydrogenase